MKAKKANGTQAKAHSKNNHQKTCLPTGRQKWQKPTLEDVSGKIMAQPYIRFT